ncbi:MAG TPA: hypothetical protein V6C91_05970 [Coleofasciculaceae cyanobacterium]
MSDGMAFLTGAAFAGVAVLFLMKGGTNLGATSVPAAQLPPVSPPATNPYNPYGTTPQAQPTMSPGSAPYNSYGNYDPQRLEAERLRAMLEQQRAETEQLKAQLQNQQALIQRLTSQSEGIPATPNPNGLFAQAKPAPGVAQVQQEENSMLPGIVWALGGMAITISGGVVVVGALSVLSRQQRPPRTTYVVQHPSYTALPPSIQARRRAEYVTPVVERQVEHVDYE